jgi:hypothetical protein
MAAVFCLSVFFIKPPCRHPAANGNRAASLPEQN